MRKISKLSLIAALAVTGFSTANAKPLEEAIKDVDVSGSVVYRYQNNDNAANNTSESNNYYKVGLNLSSKVNDFAKFNSRFLVSGVNSGLARLGTQKVTIKEDPNDPDSKDIVIEGFDLNPEVTLSHAYFGLTAIKNTTINVGKQGITTPWTTAVDAGGNDYTGTGALALSTWGPVTLAAGYFNQTNLDEATDAKMFNLDKNKFVDVKDIIAGSEDIAVLGAIGKFGPIDVDLWYADMQHLLDTYTVGVGGNFGSKTSNFGFDARYTNLSMKKDKDDATLIKLSLMGKVGIVNAKIAYGKTGDKVAGLTAFDNSSKTTMEGWNTAINGKQDAKYLQTTLGVDVINNLNLSANYNTLEYTVNKEKNIKREEKEIFARLAYAMSKNLSTDIRYGKYTNETKSANLKINDDKRGRLQVTYTF